MSEKPSTTGIVNPTNTTALMMAGITLMAAFLASGIVVIMIFTEATERNSNIAIFSAAMSAVITPLVGYMVTKKVDAVHVQMNNKMTELVASTERAAMAEGKAQGIASSLPVKGVVVGITTGAQHA